MSRLIYITLVWLLQLTVANASTFNLRVEVTPLGSGSLNIAGGTYEEGSKISLRTYNNTGYVFKGWYEGDSLLSEDNYFNYTMPSKDVVVQAKYEFDPEVPANPDTIATKYTLTVTCKPVGGGAFNVSNEKVEGGSNVHIYAYTNTGYKFLCWEDEKGGAISTSQDFNYVMPYENTKVYGVFEYDPEVPGNPNKNYWNKELGEVIVDDFKPGSLNSAISSAIGKDKRNDVTMIIVAGRMNNNDFGIANNYPNCTLLDLSRVTGISEIPSYAFDYTQLESVYLPATIENIDYAAFFDCKQLASLTIYAMTPPTLEGKVFNGVSDGLMVYVPASSISKYQEADGWKNFTILPIQEDIRSLTISLPEGTNVQDYAMMWLELNNTKNGQKMHYVMTDRMQYTFANIISNTTWNVVLRNERGDVFGQIDNVEVKDENVSVSFTTLSKPQNVVLKVKTPDGQDVTNQTLITWTDASGNYMAQGVSLKGLPSGCQVNYRLVLSQDMSMVYETPQASTYTLKEGDNNLICQLDSIKKVQLSGKVKDASTGLSLNGAVISASQTFGGKYSKTLIAKTDGNGVFTLNVSNVPTSVAYAATDFVSQTIVCDSLMNGEAVVTLPEISLKPISGATITIDFTYTTDEGDTQNWYSDYQNVSFTLQNLTKNQAINQFNVQYPQIVLLEDVEDGDELKLTATSRTNAFMPVESSVSIANQSASASFAIIELGKIQSTFKKNNNTTVVGSLYDVSGKLIKTYNYSSAQLTISNLTDGQYTLVTMGGSRLFNTIYDLAQLPQTGLAEGTDYVQNSVEVKSGTISTIHNDEVPTLDESKLYYTGDNTSFTVNKPSIVAGNYLTLTGRIDFKSAYASSVSNVQMIVDLPESCQFVENSVMVGNSTSSYTLNGHQITIPMTRYTDRVRFCIIPTLGGKYAPSAFAQFDLNGETVTQPIGSIRYEVSDLSIKVPSTVAKTTIPVSGSAVGKSTIEIYDNGILVGQTGSLGNGSWSTTVELNKPYNLSLHEIYAKVTTSNGLNVQSESKEVTYDMNAIQVSKVIMYHWNPEMHKMFESVFDFQNPSTKPNQWTVYYPNKKFTYTVDFTNNSPEKVSNVILYVHAANGQIVPLYPTYDEGKDIWVADLDMGNRSDNYYPVNVSVDFDAQTEPLVDRSEIDDEFTAWQEVFDNSYSERNAEIEAYWYKEDDADCLRLDSVLSQDSVDINAVSVLLDGMIEHTENLDSLSFEEVTNLYNQWIEHYEQWENTDAKTYLQMMLDDYYLDPSYDINKDFSYVLEQEGSCKVCSQTLLSSVDTVELSKAGYSLYKLNDGSSIYYYYSDELIDFIDVKNLKQYTIKINEITDSIASEARRVSNSVAGYAQCMKTAIYGIKNLYNDIKDARGASARDIARMLLSGLGDVLDGVRCYYDGFMKALRKSIVDRYEEAAVVFNIEKQNANNLKEAIEGSMVAYKKEAADFEKRYFELKGYVNNHPELSESQLKAYNDQLDNLYDSRRKALSNLAEENKQWKKVKSEIANIDLKLSKAAGKKTNLTNIINKNFPLTLKRGVKFPKSIRIAGKLAGQLGNGIQVICAGLDILELIDDIEAWEKVMDAIDAKIPCEAQPERALSLKQEIDESNKSHIIGGCSVILGEIVAIGVSNVAVPLSPTWWVEQAINIICEAGKAYNGNSSEGRRRKLYADVRALKCKKDPEPNPDPNSNPSPGGNGSGSPNDNVKIDPSGFVYEGVSANRVEGVTATIFYKEMVEDMYGDLHENIVKWDAEEYAQENPLFTDENGMYRWDVPQGLWQVKFEKEGYETTYSEWLPVPPPQLDVNIPMKQNIQPTVKLARAFEDAVEVEFDKYMVPEFLTTDNIMVMQGDKAVKGTIELLNEEVSYEGETETFASKVRFNAAQPFTEKEITLIVNNRVKSYADIRMQDDYQQTFAIEQEIKQILSDSLIVVEYGEKAALTVSVLPASASKGKTLSVKTSSPMILGVEAEQVIIGDDGKAEISISGELPGTAALIFTIEGSDLSAITIANVKQTDSTTVAAPTASIASGSVVEKGTQVSLFCETEGAIIYYTIDGSCPCDENGTRVVYDGTPIVIDKSMTVKAMAVAKDLNDSEIAEFIYTVLGGDGVESVIINDEIQVYPLPVRDILNISADGQIIKNVKIMTLNGRTITTVNKPAKTITLDVSSLASGVYIVFVTLENGNYSRKFVKVQ